MAEITSQEQFEKVRDALKAGEFADDPAVQDEVIAAAEAWKASQNERSSIPSFSPLAMTLRNLRGIGEVGLENITGGLASIPAGIGGALALADGPDAAADAVRDIQENLTFQPRSGEGQAMSQAVNNFFGTIDTAATDIGGILPGEELETAGKTGLMALPALLGRQRIRTGGLNNQQRILQRAQNEGYIVPTSSAVPSSTARSAIEGMAGKPRMQQDASFRNQAVTNNLAARSLGLPEGTEITRANLQAVRAEAGKAYSVLENAGTITPNVVFRRDLANAIADLKKASKDFDVLAKAETPVAQVIEMAQGLNKSQFQASSVITATRVLRDEAGAAFKNGQNKVGQAYRDISNALEDAAELHLQRTGSPEVVQAFRDARVQIAKTYSIEKALDGDGFVSAPKLAAQLKKGEPLSGELQLIAEFGEQFPQSARVIKEKPIQTGRIATIAGFGGSGVAIGGAPQFGIPLAVAAFGGPAVRASLLSRLGQRTFGRPRGEVTGMGEAVTGALVSGELANEEDE